MLQQEYAIIWPISIKRSFGIAMYLSITEESTRLYLDWMLTGSLKIGHFNDVTWATLHSSNSKIPQYYLPSTNVPLKMGVRCGEKNPDLHAHWYPPRVHPVPGQYSHCVVTLSHLWVPWNTAIWLAEVAPSDAPHWLISRADRSTSRLMKPFVLRTGDKEERILN